MYPKYELEVKYLDNYIFEGSFVSLNKAIKIACFFDDDCKFRLYSILFEKIYEDFDVKMLRKEFRNGEIFI